MKQGNTTVVRTTNACIFLPVDKYSLCATHTYIQNKVDRETVHMSQAKSEGKSSVWSRRITALSLKTQLKKMFVVCLSLLIV